MDAEEQLGIRYTGYLRPTTSCVEKENIEFETLKELRKLNESINFLIKEQKNLSEKQKIMEMDMIYEKYGKPLEKEHWGEFACITAYGDVVVGKTIDDALEASEKKGLENPILYGIGEPIYV